MPKKSDKKPQREMTKRALSHWQKENRIQRISMLVGVIVIVAVLIIVGTGVYAERYRPLQASVIKVGDASYNMDYYINMLAYYGETTGSDFIYYVTDQAAQQIQMNRLVKDAAEKLDPPITVSDEEVEKVIKERELDSNQTYKDVIRVELILEKLKTDYFDKQVPQSAEQKAVLAMFLESPKQVAEIKARLAAGESFNDIASELSRENNSKSKGGDFGWVPKGVLPSILASTNTTLENKVFSSDIKVNELAEVEDVNQSKNIGYWLLQVTETKETPITVTPTPTGTETPTPTPTTTTEKHLRAMLLPSKEKAEEIKAKLEAGGEGNDWATLADANSSYTNPTTNTVNGGDLGFVSKDNLTLGTAAKDVLFPEDASKALETNKISDPVADTERTTLGGIWLIKITGIEADKAIEGENRDKLIEIQQNSWIEKLWNDNQDNLLVTLTDTQKQYAIQKAFERL